MLRGHQYQMGGRTTTVISTKRLVSIQYKLAGCKRLVFYHVCTIYCGYIRYRCISKLSFHRVA